MRCATAKSRAATDRNSRYPSRRGSPPSGGERPSPVQRLQRGIGNAAFAISPHAQAVQPKLKIGAANDRFEREADHVADRVMRMPTPAATSPSPAPRSIQRTCSACAAGGAPCAKCGREEIQRAPASPSGAGARQSSRTGGTGAARSGVRPSAPFASMPAGGRPLSAPHRAFFEPRFGRDFGDVRIHTGRRAAEMAQQVQARAFTFGRDVVFGSSEFAPDSQAGRRLLAHELTHVVQQGHARSLGAGSPPGRTIQRTESTGEPVLQRTLTVNPSASVPAPSGGTATPLTTAVQGLIDDTCPQGNFTVDATTGNVTAGQSNLGTTPGGFCDWAGVPYRSSVTRADLSRTPVGCGCLCDVVTNSRTTTVDFRAGGPGTSPRSSPGTGRAPGQGGQRVDPTVRIDPRFQGQYRIGGRWVDVPFHLLFTHELCGHALPKMQGTHAPRSPIPPGGTPTHEVHAVDMERRIAAEHNPPLPRRPDDYAGDARRRP